MPKTTHPTRFRVTTGGPEYIALLGEKLAELAIVRVRGLSVMKSSDSKANLPFDFVAASQTGTCFLVQIAAYSSFQLEIEPGSISVLELEVKPDQIRAVRQSPTPVVVFLFDGDRTHGRYLRLDTLPEPAKSAKTVVLSFPIENTITGESIRTLADEIAKERLVPASA
jgi:hypothetical protein